MLVNIAPIVLEVIAMNTAATDKLNFRGILRARCLHSTVEIRACPYQRFNKPPNYKHFPSLLQFYPILIHHYNKHR